MRQTRRDFFGVAVAGALAGAAVTTAGGAAMLRATEAKTTTAPCEAPTPQDMAHMLAAGQVIQLEYMGFKYTGLVETVVWGTIAGEITADVSVRLRMPDGEAGAANFQVRHG